MLAHALDDIAVAHGGGLQPDAVMFHGLLEPEIAHHGGHQRVVAEFALLLETDGAKGEDPVAADHLAVGIG